MQAAQVPLQKAGIAESSCVLSSHHRLRAYRQEIALSSTHRSTMQQPGSNMSALSAVILYESADVLLFCCCYLQLGTHLRGKKKREEMAVVLRKQQKAAHK